jgi:riboflavin biosynthesis pyrimidine reductase
VNSIPILRLYPPPTEHLPLEGLYLAQDIRGQRGAGALPFIYANFITSLDGRISLSDPDTGVHTVPAAIANPRDALLYTELAAHADVLLTTARHLRALAAGRYHEIIELHADARLAAWRRAQGLAPQPAVAAVSAGLAIPLEALRARYHGPLLAITGAEAPPARVAALRAAGVDVERIPAPGSLDGGAVARALAARGHRTVYSIAGPRVTRALFAAGVLDRLYLTIVQAALAGSEFDALTTGETLLPPARFLLHELYLDAAPPSHTGQLFASFNLIR